MARDEHPPSQVEARSQGERQVGDQTEPAAPIGILAAGEALREEIATLQKAVAEAPLGLPDGSEYVVSSIKTPNRRLSLPMQALQQRVRGKVYEAAGLPYSRRREQPGGRRRRFVYRPRIQPGHVDQTAD